MSFLNQCPCPNYSTIIVSQNQIKSKFKMSDLNPSELSTVTPKKRTWVPNVRYFNDEYRTSRKIQKLVNLPRSKDCDQGKTVTCSWLPSQNYPDYLILKIATQSFSLETRQIRNPVARFTPFSMDSQV